MRGFFSCGFGNWWADGTPSMLPHCPTVPRSSWVRNGGGLLVYVSTRFGNISQTHSLCQLDLGVDFNWTILSQKIYYLNHSILFLDKGSLSSWRMDFALSQVFRSSNRFCSRMALFKSSSIFPSTLISFSVCAEHPTPPPKKPHCPQNYAVTTTFQIRKLSVLFFLPKALFCM